MKKQLSTSVFVLGVLTSANALVWDNYAAWDGNVTNGWNMQAQKFVAPSENVLYSWQFAMHDAASGQSMGFSIQETTGGNPNGTILWSSGFISPGGGGDVSFTGINLALTTGQTYAAVVDFQGYNGQSIHFTAIDAVPGNGMWSFDGVSWSDFPDLDQVLRAEFVPEPATLLAFAAGLGFLVKRKKK